MKVQCLLQCVCSTPWLWPKNRERGRESPPVKFPIVDFAVDQRYLMADVQAVVCASKNTGTQIVGQDMHTANALHTLLKYVHTLGLVVQHTHCW